MFLVRSGAAVIAPSARRSVGSAEELVKNCRHSDSFMREHGGGSPSDGMQRRNSPPFLFLRRSNKNLRGNKFCRADAPFIND
ncbi:hypothetical protein HW555_008537 [Spodoptera exigua]|uniref:Uncharacterized protein n=1 Tax=Spodoptera exigua TaxID=7107 RepID=A0A835L2N7_SPOEX|nr:hypothetical protein HW555_008537 [Spodoptera exigua]